MPVSVDERGAAAASIPAPTAAEKAVADALPIEVSAEAAQAAIESVPLWFHTFSLNGGQIYTHGVARDHRYRLPFFPEDLAGKSVLDVGAFDGFYAFLAESRGATRVVAVDNEQYRDWVKARWGVELEGGEGFRTIARLLESDVEYRKLDAFELDELGERFDLILCFGILHRVENPLGLLSILRRRLEPGGEVLRLVRRAAADHQLMAGARPGLRERRRQRSRAQNADSHRRSPLSVRWFVAVTVGRALRTDRCVSRLRRWAAG